MKDKKKEKGVSILDRWAQDTVDDIRVVIEVDGKKVRIPISEYSNYRKTHPKNKEK